MRIGLDIMGGDYAPEKTIEGAIIANSRLNKEDKLVLIGPRYIVRENLVRKKADPDDYIIEHAPEVIGMNDNASKAFSRKTKSSIALGFRMLAKGEIDGLASAGNTGAVFVGAMSTIKSIPGILRPAIAASYPTLNGKSNLILDVGLNPDCKPDVLYQFGLLGSIYYHFVNKVDNPKVGLLNIGKEEGKGNLETKSAYELMKDTKEFNFIGNIEGNDIYDYDKVDVIVSDGFAGNIVIKQAESFYSIIKERNISDNYLDRYNFENYGGTPVLGVNGNIVIGHGISNDQAICNMILQTRDIVHSNLSEKIKDYFDYE